MKKVSHDGPPVQQPQPMTSSEDTSFPETVYMSGLPLPFHGWNNAFHRTAETRDGAPIYRMEPYSLYGIFPILGVDLVRRRGVWQMEREGDAPGVRVMSKRLQVASRTPIGEWQYGGVVSANRNCWTLETTTVAAIVTGLAAIALAWKRVDAN